MALLLLAIYKFFTGQIDS